MGKFAPESRLAWPKHSWPIGTVSLIELISYHDENLPEQK